MKWEISESATLFGRRVVVNRNADEHETGQFLEFGSMHKQAGSLALSNIVALVVMPDGTVRQVDIDDILFLPQTD